jgi:hypothetical protein
LSSILQVDRAEWEAFLGKLSEFEMKYRLLLDKVDELQSKLEAEKKRSAADTEKSSDIAPISALSPPQLQLQQTRNKFLSRLENTLKTPRRPSAPIPQVPYTTQNVACCSNCGFRVASATRFCQRCGFDFGKLVCSCGRELSGSEKFCDRCGRAL